MSTIIILGTLFLLLITSFLVLFVLIHREQSLMNGREKEEMKEAYQKEILKAQLEMKEQTFQTISQEIHDGIGQILSLAKLNLNTIKLEENNAAISKIVDTKELISRAIQDLRHLSKTLNSDFLGQQKLTESVRFELEHIQKTGHYTATLKIKGDERPLDPQKELIVFRIAQENFNNIIKHANAKSISVILDYKPNQLNMEIEDDGAGFEISSVNTKGIKEKGTGIGNMYHRAKLIGAEFSINSQLDKGTISQLSLTI
ncbi:MAG: sensor histidine kinase [Bacteroidetes bacterium]|nr:sensor histidine kinase [Bacteroidota bacterium]